MTVHTRSPPKESIQLSPRSWPSQDKGDSETYFPSLRVAGHAEGMPHLGTSISLSSGRR
jgi:hypothetical protein